MCEISVDIMKHFVTLINSMSKGSVLTKQSFPMMGKNLLLKSKNIVVFLPTFVPSQPTNKPSSQRWYVNFAFTELLIEATIASSIPKTMIPTRAYSNKINLSRSTQKCFIRFRQDLLPPSYYSRPTQQRVKEKVCNKPFECKHHKELVIAIYF